MKKNLNSTLIQLKVLNQKESQSCQNFVSKKVDHIIITRLNQ
jgi:hypothetical protein